MDNIPPWIAVSISVGIALMVALLVQLILVPMQRRKIMGQPVHFTFGDSDGKYEFLFSCKDRTNPVPRTFSHASHPFIVHAKIQNH